MTTTINTTATTAFLESCGMNYTVLTMPAPHPVERDQDIKGQFHLVRSTDKVVVSPKTVSAKYVPTCPIDMISPIAPLIAEGWVTPEKGYMLSDGAHEVLSFKIDGGMLENKGTVVGEEWDHFFQIHNFQGGGAFFGTLYCKRLACLNGAVRIVQKSHGFRLRHMGALQTKYEDSMQTWKEIKAEIRKLSERMTVWNSTNVSASQALTILQDIYAIDDVQNVATRTQNELDFAMREFSNPARGTNGRTAYDIYNAITATNTHYSPRNSRETEAKRLSSLLNPNGSRNRLEARTVEILAAL